MGDRVVASRPPNKGLIGHVTEILPDGFFMVHMEDGRHIRLYFCSMIYIPSQELIYEQAKELRESKKYRAIEESNYSGL